MATDIEEPRTEPGEEEEEGGPVKTFLEHLEDLRWTLIKSIAALGIAVVVCLLAGNMVVKVLTYPLTKTKVHYPKKVQVVTFMFGTNRLGVYKLSPQEQAAYALSTNRFVTVQFEPVSVGTNRLLGLHVETNSSPGLAEHLNIPLINLGPASGFIVAFQVAIYAGIVLAAPFILFFVAEFVFPALKRREKKHVYRGMYYGIGLFIIGVCFCYFVLMPVALIAAVQYSEWLGFSAPQWRAEDYISFVSKFMLGMGVGFELPVVILVLVKIGVLNYRILSKARRYVIVINFTLGAVLTTPEVITQVLMAIPLQILYEITVWITWYWERKEKKRLAREEALANSSRA
jgi:sec-independent protein translocase protein TatC